MKKSFIALLLIMMPGVVVAQTQLSNLEGIISSIEMRDYNEMGNTGENVMYVNVKDSYIYLGIQSEKLYVASVCIADQKKVMILHASAALGRLDYSYANGKTWKTSSEFIWEMREEEIDAETISKRENYLKKYGWVANTMSMGKMGQAEFIVDRSILKSNNIYVAAGLMSESDPETIIPIPSTTAGDCAALSLVSGRAEAEYAFDPESWFEVTLTGK